MAFLDSIRRSRFYPLFLRLTRLFQLLSALASLVVFSIRVRKLYNLYESLSTATGAIEGILAAAVAYTISVTALTFVSKRTGASAFVRWLLIALDLAFAGAFIAVAVLTRPDGGTAGPCYGERKRIAAQNNYVDDPGCQLPLGTFITAIVSTYVILLLSSI